MNKTKFSLFSELNGKTGAFQTVPTNELNFDELIKLFKSDTNKKLQQQILDASSKEEKSTLKAKREYFTPYGTFSYRNNDSILTHNKIIAVDIDGLASVDIAKDVRNKLASHKSVLFATLSTRGQGVKALLNANVTYTPQEQFNQLKNVFKPYLGEFLNIDAKYIDDAQFKLSQPFYLCYDADMYVNASAEPLEINFDYKEPARKPFVKINTPINATNRVDKYILSALNNILKEITPDGARHPKIAKIKGLAQIIHYAPHLENNILESFTNQAEQMYSSKELSKRKGVRSSVINAWNNGVKYPINNASIDSIINDVKPIQLKNENLQELKLTTKYISQDSKVMDTISRTISKHKYTTLKAGMGLGKTTAILKLSKLLGLKTIIAVPTKALAEQQFKDCEITSKGLLVEGVIGYEVESIEEEQLIFTTYASLGKLNNIGGKLLVVDECHLLNDRSPILYNAGKNVMQVAKQTSKTLFISGTPDDLLDYAFKGQMKRIEVLPKEIDELIITPLVFDNKINTLYESILRLIVGTEENKDKKSFVNLNNKKAINELKNTLIKSQIAKPNEIAVFTANEEDVEHDDYINLINNSIIDDKVKIILSTCKIGEGVNINNTGTFQYFTSEKDVNGILQSCKRLRKADVEVYCIVEKTFISKYGKKINIQQTYDELERRVLSEKKHFLDNNIDESIKNQYSLSSDFYSRCLFSINDTDMLNPFELIHEVNRIKKSFYNFAVFCEDLKAKRKHTIIAEPIALKNLIGEVNEEEIDNIKTEYKKELNKFKTKVKKVYSSAEVLSIVNDITKDAKLKGIIRRVIDKKDTKQHLTDNEKILLATNLDDVKNWIKNTDKLATALNLSFEDSVIAFKEQNLFNNSKFKNCYDNLIAEYLAVNGAKSRAEHRLIKKRNNILQVFYDGEILTSKELIKKYRNNFKELGRITVAHIRKELGFVYCFDYCKKSKEYTLKKRDFENLVSLEKQQKKSTTKNTENQQVNCQKGGVAPTSKITAQAYIFEEKQSPDWFDNRVDFKDYCIN